MHKLVQLCQTLISFWPESTMSMWKTLLLCFMFVPSLLERGALTTVLRSVCVQWKENCNAQLLSWEPLDTTAVQIQQITVGFTLLPENYLFTTIIII